MYPIHWNRRTSIDSSDDSSRHSSLPASLQAHLFHRPASSAPLTAGQSHARTQTTPSDSDGSVDGDRQERRRQQQQQQQQQPGSIRALLSPAVFVDDGSTRHRPMRPWEENGDHLVHRVSLPSYPQMSSIMNEFDDRGHRHGPSHAHSQKPPPSLRSAHERNVPYYSPYPHPPPALLPNIVHTPTVKEKRPLPPLMTSVPARSRPSSLTPLISVGPHPEKPKAPTLANSVNHLSPERQPLACMFCRSRKIACKRPDKSAVDQTCNQCVRRGQSCAYPTKSRRGLHRRKLRVGLVPACESDPSAPMEVEVVLARARTNTSASASSASSSGDIYAILPSRDNSRSPYQESYPRPKRRPFENDYDSVDEYDYNEPK